jgi:hypothetical protein
MWACPKLEGGLVIKPYGVSGKQGTRKLCMQNWTCDGPGCYLVANINGTSYPINKNQPLLGPADLKLCDTEKQKYYDFSWNAYQNKHITRTVQLPTVQHTHALLAANVVKARCKDLTFEIDLSDGKWYDDEGTTVWSLERRGGSRRVRWILERTTSKTVSSLFFPKCSIPPRT